MLLDIHSKKPSFPVAKTPIVELESMLEAQTHMQSLLLCSLLYLNITINSSWALAIRATWMLPISNVHHSILRMPKWSKAQGSESDVILLNFLSDLEYQRLKEIKLSRKLSKHVQNSKVNSKASTTPLQLWHQKTRSSSLQIISCSRKEIGSSKPVDSTEIGQLEEASSTTITRLSLFGSMKRINWELSQCSQALISEPCLPGLQLQQTRSKRSQSLPTLRRPGISHLAQPISAQPWELRSISIYQSLELLRINSKQLQTSITYRSEVHMGSTPKPMTTFTISPIKGDLAFQKFS